MNKVLSAIAELEGVMKELGDKHGVGIGIIPCGRTTEHPLQQVFDRCIKQAVSGKGEERHGKGRDFFEQPWVHLANVHGEGFLTGQAAKKLEEARSMTNDEAFEREMLGVINYAAMALLHRFVVKAETDGAAGNEG